MSGKKPDIPGVRIAEQDGDVYEIVIKGQRTEITVITQMNKEEDSLVLRRLHLHGPGSGSSSFSELREAAREIGRQHHVSSVIIYGAARTTGANPGKTPIPIIIQVEN